MLGPFAFDHFILYSSLIFVPRNHGSERRDFRTHAVDRQLEVCLCKYSAYRKTRGGSNLIFQVENPITAENGGGHEQLCTVCEIFTAQATTYLNENKTSSEILDILHYACSQLHSLELKCLILVDYYSALFFTSIGKIRPEEFCGRVGLCEASSVSIERNDEKCTSCHQVIAQLLRKMKNPDAQLEVLQMLFRKCDKMKNYAQEIRRGSRLDQMNLYQSSA